MAMAMARVRVRGRAAAVAVARVSVILVLVGLLLPGNGLRVDVPESVASVHGFLRALQESLPPPSVQESAARSVLQRLLPSHNSSFQFRILPQNACEGKSCFQISNLRSAGDPEISIAATSGVELCAGLHWYLKNWCGVHISWKKTGGAQLASVPPPSALPRVNSDGIEVSRSVPWNYYQNVVTSSYSYVWWDWPRWELEIDWMALQGINLPLAFTGQETIWRNVFLSERFNLSSEDLNGFFGGPAFLAWARMGNLHGWGGPLAKPWLDQQLALQKRILERMRQLGMTPVLPAFSGNVPFALKKVFPSAKITQLGDWNTVNGDKRWCCTYLLDPTDPLFVEIGKSFVQEQIKEYGGTSHIYNCDTFNENEPPSSDPSYISSLGAAVFTAMQAGDKDAIWLMQGWLFSSDSQFWHPPQMQALLHSVPRGKMVVLDLFAEVKPVWKYSNHFYGTPYIWCMLHNFGGNIEMYGSLSNVSAGPIEARTSLGSTMVGVGMCMEGIEHNPVVYDLMAEMAFHDEKVITKEWIQSYSTRRYGKHTVGTQEAWDILYQTIYECKDGIADHNTDVIVKFPDENPDSLNLMAVPGHLWYQNMDAVKALNSLLKSASILKNVSTYRYDVADLTRQVLAKHGNELYYHILTSYQSKNFKRMRKFGNIFLELILDIDTLLQSNECFLLGSWLESAKALATNENENRLYEWNARTQVTMWYDNTVDTPSNLHDYANKYWSGLIKDYYYARASLYLQLLEESAEQNSYFPFNTWRRRWTSLTNSWQTARDSYALRAEGDTIQIARSLLWKYFKVHAKPEESYVFDL